LPCTSVYATLIVHSFITVYDEVYVEKIKDYNSASVCMIHLWYNRRGSFDGAANHDSSEVIDILLPVSFYFNSSTRLDNVKNFWRFVISLGAFHNVLTLTRFTSILWNSLQSRVYFINRNIIVVIASLFLLPSLYCLFQFSCWVFFIHSFLTGIVFVMYALDMSIYRQGSDWTVGPNMFIPC